LARFLVLWRRNPVGPWPTDPVENLELMERNFAGIDDLIKKGGIKDFGFFMSGSSGYAISEGESAEAFRNLALLVPYFEFEVQEIIPYEKGKETIRAITRTFARSAKK
jgi:hypothetical protein